MNRSIFKYSLELEPAQMVKMPEGAIVRHVDIQTRRVTLWAEVDPDAAPVWRMFGVYGTGWPIEDAATYVGTCTTADCLFVWHVYEITVED